MSMPPSGQKMVSPVSVSPLMSGQLMALRPRCRGRSEGWYWMVPCVGTERNPAGTICVTKAMTWKIRREATELLLHARVAERRRAHHRQPGGSRDLRQRVLPRAHRRGVDRHHVVAPLEQGVEHGLAERLLAVHHDPLLFLRPRHVRRI